VKKEFENSWPSPALPHSVLPITLPSGCTSNAFHFIASSSPIVIFNVTNLQKWGPAVHFNSNLWRASCSTTANYAIRKHSRATSKSNPLPVHSTTNRPKSTKMLECMHSTRKCSDKDSSDRFASYGVCIRVWGREGIGCRDAWGGEGWNAKVEWDNLKKAQWSWSR